MKFLKNKYVISISAVLIVFLISFFVIKAVNANLEKVNMNSKICEADSDCVYFDTSCCYSCGRGEPVNKNYIQSLEAERTLKCLATDPECIIFPSHAKYVDCLPPIDATFRKPFCNENKICDIKIDCEAFCEEFGGMEEDLLTREFGCECS